PARPSAKRYSDCALTPASPATADGGNRGQQSRLSVLQSKSGSRPEAPGLDDNRATLATNGDQPSAGPNPHFDIRAFGVYIRANPPTTSGHITEGSSILAINAAGDYANGQGIVVHKAGAATTLKTPGTPTVIPNLLNGATTWNYKVIAEDYKGGL